MIDDAEIERRAQERVAMAVHGLPDQLEHSVERALRRVLSDPKLREEFWAQGYVELEKHAGTNAAQWLGRRLWNIFVTSVVAAVLAWIVVTGRLK
jgi:hypothetical protein